MSSYPVHSCIIGGRKNSNWWHCFAANCNQGILKGSPNSDKLIAWTLFLLWQKIRPPWSHYLIQTIVWWSRKIPWCRQQWQRCAEMTEDKTTRIERTHHILISSYRHIVISSQQISWANTAAATMDSGSVLRIFIYYHFSSQNWVWRRCGWWHLVLEHGVCSLGCSSSSAVVPVVPTPPASVLQTPVLVQTVQCVTRGHWSQQPPASSARWR